MKNFTYYRPTSVEQAVGLLDSKWGTTELLAGGTDLLDLQKEYVAQPDKVVSLGAIEDKEVAPGAVLSFNSIVPHKVVLVKGTYKPGDVWGIGAGAKLSAIAEHAELRKHFPALTTAAGQIGGPQIRNMGTLGGNLCQRNRCWYFRDEHVPCLLKGGSKCFALDGENQYHAIFTQGHKCVIVNPSTLAPPLIALGAYAMTATGKGEGRVVTMDKFFQAPEGPDQREHVIKPNEVVYRLDVPVKGLRNASYEVRHKQAYDWPLVQAAAAFKLDGGKASDVKIVLGHVAPTPIIAESAAKALEGKEVTEETAAAAGKAATEGAKPLSQNGYKIKLVEVAVKRAILLAAGAKPYWETST